MKFSIAKNSMSNTTLICNLIHHIMPIIYRPSNANASFITLFGDYRKHYECLSLCAFAICVHAALLWRNSQMTANKHVCYLLKTELPKAQYYAIDHVVDVNCIYMVIVCV